MTQNTTTVTSTLTLATLGALLTLGLGLFLVNTKTMITAAIITAGWFIITGTLYRIIEETDPYEK